MRRPGLVRDRDGVVELPFKLIIASIIVLVTISVAYAGLDSYSRSSTVDGADAAAHAIIAAASDVSSMGLNSSVKAKVELKAGIFHRVESFVVGCGPTDSTYKCKGVEYKVSGVEETWVVAKDSGGHDIVLKGKNGKIALGEGAHELLFIKYADYIEVSKL